MEELDKIREQIDGIDLRILDLLSERARLAIEIGRLKSGTDVTFFAPSREKAVFDNVIKANKGPLPDGAVHAIFTEIISAARNLEQPLTIAYWGPPATYTHMAAVQRFGASSQYIPHPSINAVFTEVEKGNAHYGVVPIENSTEGVVNNTLDMFLESRLKIVSEIFVSISHCLLSSETSLDAVKRIYTLGQPLAQSRTWIRQNLPNAEILPATNSSTAAEMAKEEPGSAAIASRFAADHYGLNILAERIEDNPRNRTRFLVIGAARCDRTGQDKTSIMFSVPHKPGTLYRALAAMEKHGISMTMIESRPTPFTSWEYIFFIDILGHETDTPIEAALRDLRELTLFTTVLGSYPEGSNAPRSGVEPIRSGGG